MTIFMGRKAWRNVVDAVGTSATREAGEQVIVDLSLEDDVIERRTDEGRVRFGHPFFIGTRWDEGEDATAVDDVREQLR